MCNEDLRNEIRIANVKQWEVADAIGISEMTMVKWLRKELSPDKKAMVRNGIQAYNEGAIRNLLYKQREIEIDLWKEQFSQYLSEDFIDRYCGFARDRNHIMHNKLIDRSAYVVMKELAAQVQSDLQNALEKLHKVILSEEEKFEIEKQRQIEMQMMEELDHECRENDANVSIKDSYEITELFFDCLNSFVIDVEENLRFRNDVDVSSDNRLYEAAITGSVMIIKSNIDASEIKLKFDMEIDDSEGADSILSIYDIDKEFITQLVYTNGAVEYDDDSGLYMPITQDEIGTVEKMVNDVIHLHERKQETSGWCFKICKYTKPL